MMVRMSGIPECGFGDRAPLYALGLLEDTETGSFEQHLSSCPLCAAEVRESGDLAVQLAGTIPASIPPAALRDRVLAEVVLPRGVVALVRGAKMNWQATPFDGVSIARLYEDPDRGDLTSLVRMTPGARYPSHNHAGLEHCYVLEGDLVFEDHTLTAGDYSAGSPHKDHTSATTKAGCLLFIVHDRRDRVHVR
jgi:quercetin dioxygenase-like cupin family protein